MQDFMKPLSGFPQISQEQVDKYLGELEFGADAALLNTKQATRAELKIITELTEAANKISGDKVAQFLGYGLRLIVSNPVMALKMNFCFGILVGYLGAAKVITPRKPERVN